MEPSRRHHREGRDKEQNAVRETFDETGYIVDPKCLIYHGKIDSTFMDEHRTNRVHIFSSWEFSGDLRSSEEGEVRWFKRNNMPMDKMWRDTFFWLKYVVVGKSFDAKILYADSASNHVLSAEVLDLSSRNKNGNSRTKIKI